MERNWISPGVEVDVDVTYTGRVSTITLITVDALADDLAVDVSAFC
jgi:hypothetical protein